MMAKQFQENQLNDLNKYQAFLEEIRSLEYAGKSEEVRHNLATIEEVIIESNKLTQNADIYTSLVEKKPQGISSKSKRALDELKQKVGALVADFIQNNDLH